MTFPCVMNVKKVMACPPIQLVPPFNWSSHLTGHQIQDNLLTKCLGVLWTPFFNFSYCVCLCKSGCLIICSGQQGHCWFIVVCYLLHPPDISWLSQTFLHKIQYSHEQQIYQYDVLLKLLYTVLAINHTALLLWYSCAVLNIVWCIYCDSFLFPLRFSFIFFAAISVDTKLLELSWYIFL